MNANTSDNHRNGGSDLSRGIRKRFLQIFVQALLIAAILFVSSGKLDWWAAWIYLGIFVIGVSVTGFILVRKDPELIVERSEVKEGAESWDIGLGTSAVVLGLLITPLVAGLDMRFGWSSEVPLWVQLTGTVLMALGFAFSSWAMVSNPFFSGTVRIQEERGHTVATGGAYGIVRHPGYAGWILSWVATPLMLGSVWALVPALLSAIFLIARTALEDQTLQEELDGYRDYAGRVHYRLLPGVW